MKPTVLVAASVLIVACGAYLAFSQETTIPSTTQPPVDPNTVGGPPYGKACPFCSMMGQSVFATQLVPLPDGGVLLLTGGKLYKYDQNLTLVNQVEIQIDPQMIQSQMQQVMSSCPFCRKQAAPGVTNGTSNGQTDGVLQKSTKSDTKAKSPKQPKQY